MPSRQGADQPPFGAPPGGGTFVTAPATVYFYECLDAHWYGRKAPFGPSRFPKVGPTIVSVLRILKHHPTLVQLADGRFEVRCRQCRVGAEPAPIGIGIPVSGRFEAEAILINHASQDR